MVKQEGKFESILDDEESMVLINRLVAYGYDIDDIEEALEHLYEENEEEL